MSFFKQIKGKALQVQVDDRNKSKEQEERIQQKNIQKQSNGLLKDLNIKFLAKSFFNKRKEQPKNDTQMINNFDGQRRFWNVAAPPSQMATNEYSNQQAAILQSEQNPDEQNACNFIANLCLAVASVERQNKMRVSKARNAIFGQIQVQPIYMSQNSEYRILMMELQTKFEEMIERTQVLVLQKNVLDRTIQNALMCGYLWQAHDLPSQPFFESCYEIISNGSNTLNDLYEQTQEARSKLKMFLSYIIKIGNLNNRRIILAKKLKLLNRIKAFKKDAQQQFANIDQAFYIQRNRQKLYAHFVSNQKLLGKVKLLQCMAKKINRQNQKLIDLIERQLNRWIDRGEKMEKKHIEKLLILLYFVTTEKMYLDNGLKVSLEKTMRKDKFAQEINEVKNWDDYKYVNDGAVKLRVTEFLNSLLKVLDKEETKIPSEIHMDKRKKIKVIGNENGIKF